MSKVNNTCKGNYYGYLKPVTMNTQTQHILKLINLFKKNIGYYNENKINTLLSEKNNFHDFQNPLEIDHESKIQNFIINIHDLVDSDSQPNKCVSQKWFDKTIILLNIKEIDLSNYCYYGCYISNLKLKSKTKRAANDIEVNNFEMFTTNYKAGAIERRHNLVKEFQELRKNYQKSKNKGNKVKVNNGKTHLLRRENKKKILDNMASNKIAKNKEKAANILEEENYNEIETNHEINGSNTGSNNGNPYGGKKSAPKKKPATKKSKTMSDYKKDDLVKIAKRKGVSLTGRDKKPKSKEQLYRSLKYYKCI